MPAKGKRDRLGKTLWLQGRAPLKKNKLEEAPADSPHAPNSLAAAGEHQAEEEDVEPAVMKKPVATADNDFQKSLDDFKEYVAKHTLEQNPDLSIFKQFFTETNISQLWVELQRSRDKAT